MRTAEEAYLYLTEIKKLVMYLEICDGNMEEGSLRCDANVSVMKNGSTVFGSKVEVKNMNSFRNVMRAIEFERDRQIELYEAGQAVASETRMFDASTGITYSLRSKENLNDYRYFPEPDLQPFVVTEAYKAEVLATMPPLPAALLEKFTKQYGLPEYDALVLTDSKEIALYFDEVSKHTTSYKTASNWVMGQVKSHLNELTLHIDQFPITAERLASLVNSIESNEISHTAAQQKVFPEMLKSTESALEIATRLNLIQDSSSDSLLPIIAQVLAKYPAKVEEYKSGKKGLLGLFMGEVMKLSQGKADPKTATQLLEEALKA
jgi:aspartyl-tRNA(Asn)/glutamyl-tRNA(Gln) amidotransferase subunit B